MAKRALMVLAEGFEEIEAIVPADILNRVGVEVTVASLTEGPVAAAYGATIVPHTTIDKLPDQLSDALILPGGAKNAEALGASKIVKSLVEKHLAADKIVAAICAAPSFVLAESAGILKGKRATGAPVFNEKLLAGGAVLTHEHVTVDGNIITAMGPGAAISFGLMIAEGLTGQTSVDALMQQWQIDRNQQAKVARS